MDQNVEQILGRKDLPALVFYGGRGQARPYWQPKFAFHQARSARLVTFPGASPFFSVNGFQRLLLAAR